MDANSKDRSDCTPLSVAVRKGNETVVRCFYDETISMQIQKTGVVCFPASLYPAMRLVLLILLVLEAVS